MKLEDEIQQKKFKSEYQKLAVNLSYTYNWYSYRNHVHFKNFDVTPQQYNVLRILRGQYPNTCNLKLIKDRMLDRMSDASRIIDKLKNKDLVQRHECPNDRRNVDLLITQKGLELLKSLDFIDEEHKNTFSNLSLVEIKHLNDLLDKLRA
jgi:DNA-binding MarR family transcriptional regulator